jgi:hypothetical protein
LDSSLAQLIYTISISTETIKTYLNDTINLTVYDFVNADNKDKLSKLFAGNTVINKFIRFKEAPVASKCFLINGNLCLVCTRGITFPGTIDDDKLNSYLNQNSNERINRK